MRFRLLAVMAPALLLLIGTTGVLRSHQASGSDEPSGLAVVQADRYRPLSPVRLLDTRSGIGAPVGKLGSGATMTV